MNKVTAQWLTRPVVVCLCLAAAIAQGQESKTVLGPTNPDLYYGAQALLAGDADEGVRLTLLGVQRATNSRDRITGISNLCAGYIMLEQYETGLSYCDQVLAENDRHWRSYSNRALAYLKLGLFEDAEADLQKAEAIAPNARTVKVVRSMLLDVTNPVAPVIVIDDRRQTAEDDEQ
jgi:tetratricopeptide (TPR) repeat protein